MENAELANSPFMHNLMRFFFSFILGRAGTIVRIGEDQYCAVNIEESLVHFIAEGLKGSPCNTSIEWRYRGFICFYECKYFDRPMTLKECEQERSRLDHICGIKVSGMGFVCSGGFDFEGNSDFILIDGKELYQ